MEENKDKELEKKPVAPTPDDVEEVASAEDIAAFMRERRKAREEKHNIVERENPPVRLRGGALQEQPQGLLPSARRP